MMARIYAFIFFSCIVFGWQGLAAQTPTQVIIANGGVFGPSNIVSVAAWNLSTGGYTVFDSFPGSSVQHVLISGDHAYVCADSSLMKYDLTSYQRVAEARIYGVRQTAVYGNKVVVTKGYGMLDSFAVEVRNASDLSAAYAISGITGDCEGVVVVGDTAYVANPGLFGAPTGSLAVIDLQGQTLDRIIALDSMGAAIQDLFVQGNRVISLNIHGFGSSFGYITEYDIATSGVTHHLINHSLSLAAGIDQGLMYTDLSGSMGTIEINTGTAIPQSVFPGGFASLALDSVNGNIFATRSDFATYGRLYRYNLAGIVLDSVTIGISPEAIAVDYNVAVGSMPTTQFENVLQAYPQPVGERLYIDLRQLAAPAQSITVYDLNGRPCLSQSLSGNGIAELSTATLPAGAYVLQVQTRLGAAQLKLIKTH
jgi:hypothetical protein